MSESRCGRTRQNGQPCRGRCLPEPRFCDENAGFRFVSAGYVPPACGDHLTPEEREQYEAAKTRALLGDGFFKAEMLLHTSDPACWSWELPGENDRAALRNGLSKETLAYLDAHFTEQDWLFLLMDRWHAGRCAICGHHLGGALVEDHDHRTGLTRGFLCRSCNRYEGTRHGGVWDKYRSRHPASILGVRSQYWSPFTGWAEPQEPWRKPGEPVDWANHPMKGLRGT